MGYQAATNRQVTPDLAAAGRPANNPLPSTTGPPSPLSSLFLPPLLPSFLPPIFSLLQGLTHVVALCLHVAAAAAGEARLRSRTLGFGRGERKN